MTKQELRKKIEEALAPCGACCMDDERDRKKVVDSLMKALAPMVVTAQEKRA